MASKTLQEATDDFSGERKNSKEDRLDKEDSQNLTEERGASASFFDGLSDVGTSLVSAPISILESLGKKTFEQLTLKSEVG
ncbi:hypothetical protein AB6A40_011723 [Gnathostoma spinigerum]|uniref:Uncharacterized protein n=1 Tax=Gnathostoma spinigerum TaxID=75299 RepID=A0ABD6F2B4_9BILA